MTRLLGFGVILAMGFPASTPVAMGQSTAPKTTVAGSADSAPPALQTAAAQTTVVQPPVVQPLVQPPAVQASPAQSSEAGALPDNPRPVPAGQSSSSLDPPLQNKVITLPRQLLNDQIGMWTSPAKAKLSDATWLVPVGGLAAALFSTDSDFSRHLSNTPSTLNRYRHISDYGV